MTQQRAITLSLMRMKSSTHSLSAFLISQAMLLPPVSAASSFLGIVESSAVKRALPRISWQDHVPSDFLKPPQDPITMAGLAESAAKITLILESMASAGMMALEN